MHNTHISRQIRALHSALLDIMGAMNRPQQDEFLIRQAGIAIDRALFPLLVRIERFGPIGIGDLADRVGRDYSTVSRQVSKLEKLGLVERRDGKADRRVSAASVTPKGKAMTALIDAARERIVRKVFSTWPDEEFDELVRLVRKLADAFALGDPPG